MWAPCERTQCSQQYFSQTLCRLHPELNGGPRKHNRGYLRGGPAAVGVSPFFFLSAGWTAGGVDFAGCSVGAILVWLEAAAELERLGRKCRIASDDFCAAVKHSAKPSTAGPNRPVGETGELRKGTLSASFISVRFNHRWRSCRWSWSICRGRLLPSSQWLWAARDAWPLTYPGEAGCHILFLSLRWPKWGRRKKRHIGGSSRVHAKIWWSHRGPLGRMVKLVDDGPAGAPARTFIHAATGRFLWGRPFQTQLIYSARQDAENIGIHAWAGCAGLCRMKGGGVMVQA